MCMQCVVEVEKASQDAFKVFSLNESGQLQSVFRTAWKGETALAYPPNQRIRVNVEDANFFAFENFQNAISIARQGRMFWNMVNDSLIVLPVTMYEVVATGIYLARSNDLQCMDGRYPALESKEIIVHDTEENRAAFYDGILSNWFVSAQYSLSKIEKEAFMTRIPFLSLNTRKAFNKYAQHDAT